MSHESISMDSRFIVQPFLRFFGLQNSWRRKPVDQSSSKLAETEQAEEFPPEWCDLPGTECLEKWSEDLRVACSTSYSAQQWRIVGKGGVIEHSDLDACNDIFRRSALHAGLQFLAISGNNVPSLLENSKPSLLARAPAMVLLEHGEWLHAKMGSSDRIDKFRESLRKFMKGFDPSYPIIFVTVIPDLADMEDYLKSPDMFDHRFALRKPTPLEFGKVFLKELGHEICGASMRNNPEKVGLIGRNYEEKRIRDLHILHLQRLAHREQRALELVDFIFVATHGSIEVTTNKQVESKLRSTAIHEAGHAVVAIIDSSGLNTPDLLSVKESHTSLGRMVHDHNYDYSIHPELTYGRFCERIRCHLAGRAAEELVLGPKNVTAGCRSDLSAAASLATRGFKRLGFAPHMDRRDVSSTNLRVVDGDKSNQEQEDHFGPMIRDFLADQYRTVLLTLTENRSLLDEITEALMRCEVLDQDALKEISVKCIHSNR